MCVCVCVYVCMCVCPCIPSSQAVCHLELNTHTAPAKKTWECTHTLSQRTNVCDVCVRVDVDTGVSFRPCAYLKDLESDQLAAQCSSMFTRMQRWKTQVKKCKYEHLRLINEKTRLDCFSVNELRFDLDL